MCEWMRGIIQEKYNPKVSCTINHLSRRHGQSWESGWMEISKTAGWGWRSSDRHAGKRCSFSPEGHYPFDLTLPKSYHWRKQLARFQSLRWVHWLWTSTNSTSSFNTHHTSLQPNPAWRDIIQPKGELYNEPTLKNTWTVVQRWVHNESILREGHKYVMRWWEIEVHERMLIDCIIFVQHETSWEILSCLLYKRGA